MNESGKIKVSNEKELYKILPKEFRNNYSIGMHGFKSTNEYWDQDEKGIYKLNETRIQQTKDSILRQGLKIQEGRTLLSTARFKDLSRYISTRGSWEAGGIIIALPKVLRSKDGKEIFVGGPNEDRITKEHQWDRNHQATSLSEVILPEDRLLDPMFIIGTYTKNDDEIEVTLNENHIVFNRGVVPNEYFKEKQEKLTKMMMSGQIDMSVIAETNRQKRNKVVSLTALGKRSYQHFGREIAGKLKETVNTLKSKFLAKDMDKSKTEELSDER